MQKGQAEEAIACFRAAVALNPQYADGHYNLGVVFKKMGNENDALEHFRRAAELNPNLKERPTAV
jgi:tetratricopeptide (TPR) repeat protein